MKLNLLIIVRFKELLQKNVNFGMCEIQYKCLNCSLQCFSFDITVQNSFPKKTEKSDFIGQVHDVFLKRMALESTHNFVSTNRSKPITVFKGDW